MDVFPQVPLETFLNQPKRVKLGFDPTSDFLHLGHSILLRKLKDFQQQGHTPVVIIGDFTARIGDPTGKTETRKQLSSEEVAANSQSFLKVLGQFIDLSKSEIVFNSGHLASLKLEDLVKLQSTVTVQQLLAKQDFSSRMANQNPIHLHEFTYPLLQGFDSFAVKSDIELGGTDQRFNVSFGRDIQKFLGLSDLQVGMLMPILVGTDGSQKMSKSLGNAIGIDEHPLQMFSKLEKIPDSLVEQYCFLLTDFPVSDLPEDPREKQKKVALEVVASFHGIEKAKQAQKDSLCLTFSQPKSDTDNVPQVSLAGTQFPIRLVNLMSNLGLTDSVSDARRKVKAGSVRLDGVKVENEVLVVESERDILGKVLQISRKHFFKFSL